MSTIAEGCVPFPATFAVFGTTYSVDDSAY